MLPGLQEMLSSGGTETSQGQPFARYVHMYLQGVSIYLDYEGLCFSLVKPALN